MSKRTIGFFGDSFCSKSDSGTYIDIITKELDLEIVHLGVPGSSVDDLILQQFSSFDNSLVENWHTSSKISVPDICVFCWTDLHRLYNKQIRNINGGSLHKHMGGDLPLEEKEIWESADNYYKIFYDHTWHLLRHNSMIFYFNNHLLKKYPDKKFINLWSFPPIQKNFFNDNKKDFNPDNESYPFNITNGVEVRPSLMSLAMTEKDVPASFAEDLRPNHLASQKSNRILANVILSAIKNYELEKLIIIDMDKTNE